MTLEMLRMEDFGIMKDFNGNTFGRNNQPF